MPLRVMQFIKTTNSMHSCYGTGAAWCTQVEIPMPGSHQGTPEGNARLIRYEGGVRVDKKDSQNEQRNVP
jgi:filamentous hemagglutinin